MIFIQCGNDFIFSSEYLKDDELINYTLFQESGCWLMIDWFFMLSIVLLVINWIPGFDQLDTLQLSEDFEKCQNQVHQCISRWRKDKIIWNKLISQFNISEVWNSFPSDYWLKSQLIPDQPTIIQQPDFWNSGWSRTAIGLRWTFIDNEVANGFVDNIDLIPLKKEKYVSLTKQINGTSIKCKFIDSLRFTKWVV